VTMRRADGRAPTIRRGKKVAEVLAREILKDASSRGLKPGSRLEPESEMIERLGVGRASLREALRILEVQGLITIRPGPGGGPMLADVSSRDYGRTSTLYFMAEGATYGEVIEARVAMMGLTARLAAESATPEDAALLQQPIEASRRALGLEDRAWAMTTSGFYGAVADLCENRVVALFALALMSIYLEHLPPMRLDEEHRRRIIGIHERIAKAVGRHDGRTAERLMTSHLLEFAEDVSEAYPAFMDEVVDWE
jgi:GntR family transcriptional regulator, transcriptional repressor for pyruvate dehydrogenase complex